MPDPSAFPGSDVRQLIKLSQPGMILVFSPESCSHPISLHFSDPIAIPEAWVPPCYQKTVPTACSETGMELWPGSDWCLDSGWGDLLKKFASFIGTSKWRISSHSIKYS